jgi:hypothetical protein
MSVEKDLNALARAVHVRHKKYAASPYGATLGRDIESLKCSDCQALSWDEEDVAWLCEAYGIEALDIDPDTPPPRLLICMADRMYERVKEQRDT